MSNEAEIGTEISLDANEMRKANRNPKKATMLLAIGVFVGILVGLGAGIVIGIRIKGRQAL